ncbi:MAG: hypothetical protein A2Y73_06975 [Chloroflexi bacterium RBG_13_56_8]|nr:MAG: hypothetical protein A2Y73_06975 [Chloroflexi bacterium RBG_13_56_8]
MDALRAQVSQRETASRTIDVRIGAFWTLVVVETGGEIQAGLAATLQESPHAHGERPSVRDAGNLRVRTPLQLADLAHSASPLEAALNALLLLDESACTKENARDLLLARGAGKRVAMIGHFPFANELRKAARSLWVLELNPQEGDLPAEKAAEILPLADVVAITGTTLINHTFDSLIPLCREDAYVVMLGGTTPLSPLLFTYGVDVAAGTRLTDVEAALNAVSEGATYHQIPGKRLLTLAADKRS